MPAPTVRARDLSDVSSNATSHPVALPTHQAGDILLVAFSADGTPSLTPSSGWVQVQSSTVSASEPRHATFAMLATSNTETLTVTSSASEQSRHLSWSIQDHGLTSISELASLSAIASGDSNGDATVPTVSGLTSSVDYLSILSYGGESVTTSTNYPTSAPSGWGQLRTNQNATSTANGAVVVTAEGAFSGVSSIGGVWSRPLTVTRTWVVINTVIPGAGPSGTNYPASGTVATVSTAQGSVTRRTPTSGTVTATTTVSGDVTVIAGLYVSGTVTVSSTAAGAVTKRTSAVGTVTSTSTVNGAASRRTQASGTITAVSNTTGTVRQRWLVSGVVGIYSGVTGALRSIEAPTLPPTHLLRPTATVTLGDLGLEATSGDITLDSSRAPYAMASFEVALTDPDDIESIDPRSNLRATITAGDEETGVYRDLDLSLRSRTVNHKARTVSLELVSDEALLMDYAPLTTDSGARAQESSLRGVVGYVLDKIGTTLAPGTADADVTATWPLRNRVLDPSAANTSALQFVGAGNANSVSIQTDYGWHGTTRVRWTAGAGGYSFLRPFAEETVRRFDTLTFSAYMRAGGKGPQGTIRVYGMNEASQILESYEATPQVIAGGAAEANQWTRLSLTVTFTHPDTTKFQWFVSAIHSGADSYAADGLMVVDGAELTPWFHGASTPDAYYTYGWDGTPNASASTRAPLTLREPEIFEWPPGVSAWEFLTPITTAAGLKLFCDEHRVWRLIDPATYTVPGLLTMAGFNVAEGTDTIDRSNPETYCTGVVVKYRWTDSTTGQQREAIDSAGVSGSVLVWEFDRPSPGPGAAAAILARREGAGRVQDVTAIADWTATPGMEARISLPATIDQQGTLSSVRWDLNTGLMDAGTSNLLDAPPDSWLGFDPAPAWSDIPNNTDNEWRDY